MPRATIALSALFATACYSITSPDASVSDASVSDASEPTTLLVADLWADFGSEAAHIEVRVALDGNGSTATQSRLECTAMPCEPQRVAEWHGVRHGHHVIEATFWRAGEQVGRVQREVEVGGPTTVTLYYAHGPQIVTGVGVTCARFGTRAWCWGAATRIEEEGRPGDVVSPTELPFPVLDICGSLHETCFLGPEGSLRCVQANPSGEEPSTLLEAHVPGYVDVECGTFGNHLVCLRHRDGHIACSGRDAEGQLGDGPTDSTSASFDDFARVLHISDAIELGVGVKYACALVATDDGNEVYCWGDPDLLRAATGPESMPMDAPAKVALDFEPHSLDVDMVQACVSRSNPFLDGIHAVCWGAKLGTDLRVAPSDFLGPGRGHYYGPVTGISHVCMAHNPEDTTAWNVHCLRKLDGDDPEAGNTPTFEESTVAIFASPVMIDSSFAHTCALEPTTRAVTCWGDNTQGAVDPAAPRTSEARSTVHLPRE